MGNRNAEDTTTVQDKKLLLGTGDNAGANRDLGQELRDLIVKIERHRRIAQIEIKDWVKRHLHYLGSARTYNDRLLRYSEDGNRDHLKSLKIRNWIEKLSRLLALLDGTDTGETPEGFYDLPIFRKVLSAFHEISARTDDQRCVIVPAVTGAGKTWTLREIGRRYDLPYIQLSDTWKTNPTVMTRNFAAALGLDARKRNAADNLEEFINELRAKPRTILIDDGHYGGVNLFKFVKETIDRTRASVIIAVYTTTWAKLVRSNAEVWQEARQLLGRCYKPAIDEWSKGSTEADIEAYIRAALPEEPVAEEARELTIQILPILRERYNLRLLYVAVKEARLLAEHHDRDITSEFLLEQIHRIKT